ncbi:MAG: TAXI family TRAP transporter solute-binding subunit [Alphaproteobacteria bacterium]|nr:TAXI family TRAP transporter solute-binding subunit [Alphaproteobacteria bacterium]
MKLFNFSMSPPVGISRTLKALMVAMLVLAVPSAGVAKPCNPNKEIWFDIGITTGGETGTYFQFGKDLQKLVGEKLGLKLGVLASPGSLENMRRVRKEPDAQLGIVQHDVLARIKELPSVRSKDPCHATTRQMVQRTRIVAPLYDEEVHILARREAGISSLADLHNKVVAIGSASSGSAITAERLFLLAGVRPGRKVGEGGQKALDQLKDGRIDAMVYVAGAPVPLFVEQVKRSDGLHFVPILLGRNPDVYEVDQWLDGSSYPWMRERVRTIAVKAVLVTYDYKSTSKPQKEKCYRVGKVACALKRYLDELKRTGHRKWQSVDLERKVKGWEVSRCVSPKILDQMDASCKIYENILPPLNSWWN